MQACQTERTSERTIYQLVGRAQVAPGEELWL